MAVDEMSTLLQALTSEASLEALEMPAPWRGLSELQDRLITALAGSLLGAGRSIVALGSYGRGTQTRLSEIELLIVAPGHADDIVRAIVAPLWDQRLPVTHRIQTPNRPIERDATTADLLRLLDARLVCGDVAAFATFMSARRLLIAGARRRLLEELASRQRARTTAEPWQVVDPDLVLARGGIEACLDIHRRETIDALADDRHPPTIGDPSRPFTHDLDTLLRAWFALHATLEARTDRPTREAYAALAGITGNPSLQSEVLQSMRNIDAAASEAAAEEASRGGRLARSFRRLLGTPRSYVPEVVLPDLTVLLGVARTGSATLDPIPAAPWQRRLLPEWDAARAVVRNEVTHAHPLDTHLARTVAEVRRALGGGDADAALIAADLPDRDELLLAALLHDIGLGIEPDAEADHARLSAVIAERFTSRAALDVDASRRIVQAVEHHQLLSTVAMRRDIADEQVIAEVAATLGDLAVLHMVYLLTLADTAARGTEADVWRSAQVRTLYARVLHFMTATEDARSLSEIRHDAAVETLAPRFGAQTVETHLQALPARYLLAMSPTTIADHLDMVAALSGSAIARHDTAGGMHRITVVTADRPGILADVAGAVTIEGLNVLGGTVFTRDDGVAIDVLHVAVPAEGSDTARWDAICGRIVAAIERHVDFEEWFAALRDLAPAAAVAPPPPAVSVNNGESDQFSILEVRTDDRVGLLYAITHALSESGLDIHLAKVDTVAGEAFDAFYVRRGNGRRLEAADEIERLSRNVREAVARLDAR